jgi:hypothetical protein
MRTDAPDSCAASTGIKAALVPFNVAKYYQSQVLKVLLVLLA